MELFKKGGPLSPGSSKKKKKSKVPSGQGPALSSSTRSLVGDIQRDRSQSFVDERQDQDSKSLADLAEETGLRSFDPYLPENPVAGSSRIRYEDPFTPEGYKGPLQVFSKGAVSPPVTFSNPEYFSPREKPENFSPVSAFLDLHEGDHKSKPPALRTPIPSPPPVDTQLPDWSTSAAEPSYSSVPPAPPVTQITKKLSKMALTEAQITTLVMELNNCR